jgi:bifunctional non-homologous end joining protein LigD
VRPRLALAFSERYLCGSLSLHPPGFIEPCLPTGSRTAPTGPQWAYEIRHDGFRFICHRDDDRVRVFSRTGREWGAQLPTIAAALRALPVRSVILDSEGVICGPDGVSDFDRMRGMVGRKGSSDVFLYAFDVLDLDGRDLRAQCWDARAADPTSGSLPRRPPLVGARRGYRRRGRLPAGMCHGA